MVENATDNKRWITCPGCGKSILKASSGEMEIICGEQKCRCKFRVNMFGRKLEYEIVENDKITKNAS